MMIMAKRYDVVIIGSGMSGLSCASLISQIYKKNVLIIEQHSKIGGFSQTYSKDGYSWEVGIHQIGELSKTSLLSQTFDIITRKNIKWKKMPEKYIKFYYPDFVYEIASSKEKQIKYLSSLFPEEMDNIKVYYEDIQRVANWYVIYNANINNPEKLKKILDNDISKIAFQTLEEYLSKLTKNQKLRSFLSSQWPDYGLPPSVSAFVVHALLVTHLLNGVYFPEFGAQSIVEEIESSILENGGAIITNTLVERINYEGKQVQSVTVRDLNFKNKLYEIEADYFISTIGIINTYCGLLNKIIPQNKIDQIKKWFSYGTSHIGLFATLNKDPREFGENGELSWIFESYDHNEIYFNKLKSPQNNISHCTFSFPSIKKNLNDNKHTMIINSLVDSSVFIKWINSKDSEYYKFKENIGLILINMVEKKLPGIKDAINSWTLSTPLTTKRITQHYNGFIYGLPSIPDRYKDHTLNTNTPLNNFFISGVDITGFGIYGAISSSILTIPTMLNDKEFFLKVLKKAKE